MDTNNKIENNKYYTPEIKEFCIGFEYEEEVNNLNWNKMIRPPEDNYEWVKLKLNTNHSISKIIFKIKKQKIRVKYLNKQDIEDCGLVLCQIPYDSFDLEFDIKYNNTSIGSVTFNNDMSVDELELFGTIFYIKNKHEFSKILKQLGIDGK